MTITPNEYQIAIWEHMESRPEHLVVEACAGSGKSTTLTGGLERLPYGDVVMTSFGVDICDELAAKIPPNVRAKVKTMSGLGYASIMRSLRPPNKKPDGKKLFDHTAAAIATAGVAATNSQVQYVARAVERSKSAMVNSPEAASTILQLLDVTIPKGPDEDFSDLEAGKIVLNALMRCATDLTRFDYADMIWLPLVRNLPIQKYRHVLVDEAQDLDPAQIMFARQLVAPEGRLIAVGDENQSVYGFRGADSQAMSRVVAGFNARTLPLSISYRCPKRVVAEAQKYVPTIQAAPWAKEGIVEHIDLDELADMVDPGDVVLSRANAPLAKIGAELKMAGIPVVQLGRDVGEQYIDLIHRSKTTTVEALRSWLDDYLAKRLASMKDEGAIDDLRDKVETTKNFSLGHSTSREVVKYIRTVYADDVKEKSVILSTTHKFKGKEARRVFVLWASYLRRDGAEERHLAYVAITRSSSELYFVEGDLYER